MITNFLQGNSNNNNDTKWNHFTYNEILEEAKQQGLLKSPKESEVAEKVNVYTKQNTIFLIIEDNTENTPYIIYYFSHHRKNILGEGAYATVYAGKNLATGEDVAIKTNNDHKIRTLYQYPGQPSGWSLVKNKLNGYEHFAKVIHFGCDFEDSKTNDKKYYLIMEKLELKKFDGNILDMDHLHLILNKAFDAITIMYSNGISGIDWTGVNLYLDTQGNPRFIDYDNWRQTSIRENLIKWTNISYSHLISIIKTYYWDQEVQILYRTEYYNEFEKMEKSLQSMTQPCSKEGFFEIVKKLIAMGEKELLKIKPEKAERQFAALRL